VAAVADTVGPLVSGKREGTPKSGPKLPLKAKGSAMSEKAETPGQITEGELRVDPVLPVRGLRGSRILALSRRGVAAAPPLLLLAP
jgi:hypothetical protein